MKRRYRNLFVEISEPLLAPPPGFEPGPYGTKGRSAAVTPQRIAHGCCGNRRASSLSDPAHPAGWQ